MKAIQVLFGVEPFLIEERVNEIIKKYVPAGMEEYNLSRFDMRDTPIDAAIEDAETLCFMGGVKVVVAQDCVFLTGEKTKGKVEHNIDRLERYVDVTEGKEVDDGDSILILTVNHEKLDARKKITKRLKKTANFFEAKPLSHGLLAKWVREQADKRNVKIENYAVDLLTQLVGSNLTALHQEIHKLALNVGEGNTITEKVVGELVARTLEQDVFLMIDKVIHKRLKEAIGILHDLTKVGEEPIKIVALLAMQYRRIFQVKMLSKQGYSQSDIAKRLGVHPYPIKLAAQQAGYFEKDELLFALNGLTELDWKFKTGQVDNRKIALEMFIAELTQTNQKAG